MEKENTSVSEFWHMLMLETMLSEAILYTAGNLRKFGRVDNGDAFLDTYELERSRGITIFSKQAEVSMEDMDLTLLDTPGHLQFFSRNGTYITGIRLCDSCDQWCRWSSGTYTDFMEPVKEIRDPNIFIYQ